MNGEGGNQNRGQWAKIANDEFDGIDCANHPDSINMNEIRQDRHTCTTKLIGAALKRFQRHKEKFFKIKGEALYNLGVALKYRKPDAETPQG